MWLLPRKKGMSTILPRNIERIDTICYLFLCPFFESLNASPLLLYLLQEAALTSRSLDILSYLVQEASISTRSHVCYLEVLVWGPSKRIGALCPQIMWIFDGLLVINCLISLSVYNLFTLKGKRVELLSVSCHSKGNRSDRRY